jgi:hypothetical protein
VRPSDENQANPTEPHLRPNLMSSARRGGNEDSILAKLEREPARRAGADSGARLVWYGSAVVVALGLTATLAWLAAGQGDGPPVLQVARADVAPLLLPAEAPASGPAAAPVETALVIDAPPEQVQATAPPVTTEEVLQAPPVPPLRLLEPAGARPAPVNVAPTPVKALPPRFVARPAAGRDGAKTAAPARARAPAPRTASRQPTRAAKTTAPARPGETQGDSDVALISAVIYHANGHAVPEPGPAPDTCAGDACRPRPAR